MNRPGAAPRPASDGLSVLFECAPWVCAIPTSWIKGLLTVDEGRLLAASTAAASATAGAAVRRYDPRAPLAKDLLLSVGSQWFAPWDFGQMMGQAALASGWLLFQIRHAERDIPLALRVGPCTAVHVVAGAVPLPRALFRARQAAFEGAFVFDPGAGVRASIGLRVNPAGLWTARELEQSARLIASLTSRPERRHHG
jgi:hypothetical protein